MRTLTPKVLAAALLLLAGSLFSQNLFINEFLASNATVIADEFGGFDDWVEIYNAEAVPVDIGGMYVTDDLTNPTKWQIPTTDPTKTTIPAGGYLLLWLDGEPAQGVLHADPKLGAGGEDIGLFAVNGTPIDTLTFGPQSSNISYGRLPDGGAIFEFFTAPTPGETNVSSPGGTIADVPTASVGGGFKSAAFNVVLTSTTPNAAIYYTLDGSDPTDTSTPYSGALPVSQTTTLRTKAYANGLLPSSTSTFTYLFENSHTFPVVALSFNDDDFFDPVTGIYPNYTEEWDRPVHVELFETDGTEVLSQDATVEIHGTGSAQLPQKSLKVKALANNGSGYFEYPIFPDQPYNKYQRFVMRNSGQDWNYTMFHDAMVASLSANLIDVGGIIQPPRLFQQAFRPGVVYLNGEFWGIHNLREHMKSEYIEQHFGLTENEIDLLDNDEVADGTADGWNALTNFLSTNNMADDANLVQLGQMVDLPNFLDYNVFNIIVDASDWPGNNYRRWRDKNNGLWRFMTIDLDFTFGFFNFVPGGPTWNTGDASANALARSLDATQTTWPNPKWSTLYFRKPMENEKFRRDYINRTADMLNVLFDPARVNARIDEFEALYLPEMQRHFDRWSSGWNPFLTNVAKLRNFANERPQYMRQYVVDAFAEVTGTASVTLQTDPVGAGNISFSTLNLSANNLLWTGKYFKGVDIPVTVVPAPGYVFDGWTGANLGNAISTTINLSGDVVLTAHFTQTNTPLDNVVINEINYNSPDVPNSGDWLELYNPNNQTVDLSGWTLEDSGGEPFTIHSGTLLPPDGYLVLAENGAEFSAVYPTVSNFLGNFGDGLTGFKFSNNNELIVLKNANQAVVDSVHYDDEAPWPADADGNGPTLQLTSPTLDNALAQSWIAQTPTPGKVNTPVLQSQTIDFSVIANKLTTDQPFSVTATATSGQPVAFEIVSGPATVSGNTIILAGTAGTVKVRATQSGNAQWQAAIPVERTFEVTGIVPPPPPSGTYCTAKGQQPWLEWIGRVSFANIDNTSFKNQYGNFTNLTANVGLGETIALTVEPKFSWQTFDEYIRAWIDFNHDFDFDDPGEMVLEAHGVGAASTNVLIPTTAANGATRMRIAMQRGQYAAPCETFTFGEVEDYTVQIGTSTAQPQTIDFPAISDKSTTSPPFTISATATSGLSVAFALVSGPASVSGSTVTLTGTAGTVTIRATQTGNAQWQSAPTVTRTFEVTSTAQSQTINFPSIPNKTTTSPPFPISATATSGLPVTFTVVSGPATVSGSTVTLTGTAGTVTIRATQTGNAQWQAAPAVTRTFEVTGIAPPPPPSGTYCTSKGNQPWLEWISRVEFGSIDHSSFKDQYGNFTNVSTTAVLGATMPLKVTLTYSWEVFGEYFRVWIDFNHDFDFDDPGEMVLEANGTSPVSANVTIPQTAVQGATRMRVSMQRGQFPAPCGNFQFGEVEDYTVNISDSFNSPKDDGKATQMNLLIAPNPTGDRLNATFNLLHEGEAKLTIINGNGVVVYSEKRYYQSGNQQFSHDVSALKSGPYMLFVQPEKQKAGAGRFMKVEE